MRLGTLQRPMYLVRIQALKNWPNALPEVKTFAVAWRRNHHGITHGVGDKPGDQKIIDDHKKIDRYYADRFEYLLRKLDSIREADGTSVLENTLILSGHDTTTRTMPGKVGPHTGDRSPFLLAGGRNFAFKTGRYLQLAKPTASANRKPILGAFVPHNRLLVSVGRAFGLDIDTFGTLDNAKGGLPML